MKDPVYHYSPGELIYNEHSGMYFYSLTPGHAINLTGICWALNHKSYGEVIIDCY